MPKENRGPWSKKFENRCTAALACVKWYCRNGTEVDGLHIRVNSASAKPKVCLS